MIRKHPTGIGRSKVVSGADVQVRPRVNVASTGRPGVKTSAGNQAPSPSKLRNGGRG